jgi:hypothetical protein
LKWVAKDDEAVYKNSGRITLDFSRVIDLAERRQQASQVSIADQASAIFAQLTALESFRDKLLRKGEQLHPEKARLLLALRAAHKTLNDLAKQFSDEAAPGAS